jgi:hypothetical protein
MATTQVKIIYLESRLDDVERELGIINGRKSFLEERRKTLLENINKLDEDREVDTRVAYIKKRNGL